MSESRPRAQEIIDATVYRHAGGAYDRDAANGEVECCPRPAEQGDAVRLFGDAGFIFVRRRAQGALQ